MNVLKECESINKEYNYFNTIAKDVKEGNGKLKGYYISVKDCICVKGMETTSGSQILKGYKPTFNATVIDKIQKEGGAIIGKTTQDEFGFGSFNVNTKNIPKNPFDKTRSCGGSSGGAAGITQKANFKHIAISESTGGSIACPAGFCGVIGYTPTYGLISRYGLIDYANSLDKIGIMAKDIKDVELMLNIIKGNDQKDSTSLKENLEQPKIKKVAVIKESLNVDKDVKDLVLKQLKDYDTVSLPLVEKYALSCYYILAMSEASTNLAKYCGMRYGASENLNGSFDEYFSKVRSENFGKEAKRRIILGTFTRMAGYRDAYYLKAMKIRRLITEEYKKLFKKYDLIVSPTMPVIAPKFNEIEKLTPMENYMMDILTVGPNLAGLPHISYNAGFKDKMPVGIMYIADHMKDLNLIEIGKNGR